MSEPDESAASHTDPSGRESEVPPRSPTGSGPGMICPACGTEYAGDARFCPADGSTLRAAFQESGELVGTIVDDRYHLQRKLGHGGMAEVYLGKHVRARRLCAVKVVNPRLADDREALSRFIREATNAGRINHPHVATIYDIGETADGLLYIAMEYVEGEPLAALLEREGAFPPARAVEIAQQIADAVGAAHELGIVHCDLKPGNIMVSRDRKGGDLVKVVDFGIARSLDGDQQRLTRTGMVIGTPAYMSPEQLIGDPVDARSDIYSLGCILFQMLTGEHAFGGSTAQVITRRLTRSPPPPRTRNPSVPKRLDEVTVTALGRIPAERYQTMDELRQALLAAPVRPVTTGPGRLARWLGLDETDEGAKAAVDPLEPEDTARTEASGPEAPPGDDPFLDREPGEPPISEEDEALGEPAGSDEPKDSDRSAPTATGSGGSADDSEASGTDEPDRDATWLDPWESEEQFRRRRRRRRTRILVTGAGAATVLVAAAMLVANRGGEVATVPDPPPAAAATPAAIAPVTELPASRIDDIHVELTLADRDAAEFRFVEATRRLRALTTMIAGLTAEYPHATELRDLADSTQAEIERVFRRCDSFRIVREQRNEPAPQCEPDA